MVRDIYAQNNNMFYPFLKYINMTNRTYTTTIHKGGKKWQGTPKACYNRSRINNYFLINNYRSRNNICDLRSLSYNKLVDEDKNNNVILSQIGRAHV